MKTPNLNDHGPANGGVRGLLDTDIDRGALDKPLNRGALNDNNKIVSTGNLSVDVNAPPGTKVNYSGNNLLKNTSLQRQTQMLPTEGGPTVADTAQTYMRGGT